jgi:hypothetical protein
MQRSYPEGLGDTGSVFKKWIRRVSSRYEFLRRSSKSKFSVGDRYGKFVCEEDATCELKVLFELFYEDYDR